MLKALVLEIKEIWIFILIPFSLAAFVIWVDDAFFSGGFILGLIAAGLIACLDERKD